MRTHSQLLKNTVNFENNVDQPRFISGIGQLVLPQRASKGLPRKPLRIIQNTWLEIENCKVVRYGGNGESPPEKAALSETIDVAGMLVTPGLVDCHSHPVFAGTRQNEFVRRCQGASYQEIATEGGGILSTVRGVRTASESELADAVLKRFDKFLIAGTTSIEGKSGYGLSLEDELKSLRALKKSASEHPLEVSQTLLAAHVVPPEFKQNADDYVQLICDTIIPAVKDAALAEAVDVFVEDGAYSLKQAEKIFHAAKDAGLRSRIHADQFTAGGGAQLAAAYQALTADHMDQTDDTGIQALADSSVVVTLLPGAVFFLGMSQYAPARKMVDAGCRIAISTDFNPGSAPTQSLPLMMTIACIYMHLTPDETLWATTMGGAYGVDRADNIGGLEPGYQADLCVWDAEDINYLPYSYGNMLPEAVFKAGKIVAASGKRINR